MKRQFEISLFEAVIVPDGAFQAAGGHHRNLNLNLGESRKDRSLYNQIPFLGESLHSVMEVSKLLLTDYLVRKFDGYFSETRE